MRAATAPLAMGREASGDALGLGGARPPAYVGPPPAPVDWNKKNPLKALFFAQVSPLIAEGTVRRLEPTDLCHLEKLDSERVRL